MKKIILAGLGMLACAALQPANAADLPVKAPVYKPSWSWTGYYVGVNIGYSWGRSDTDASYYNSATGVLLFASSNSFDMNGLIGGGQIGANWQNGNIVFGVEADIQGSAQKGSLALFCPGAAVAGGAPICNNTTAILGAPFTTPVTGTFDQKLSWFGTLRGRIGIAWSPMMLYVTGGLAYGEIETDVTLRGFTAAGAVTTAAFGNSVVKGGWTVGVGAESQLSGNWTGKIEYLYMDLGNVWIAGNLPTNTPPLFATFNSHITDHILRVGVNYKFGGAIYAKN
jgi:outer membrane immunogenic protein